MYKFDFKEIIFPIKAKQKFYQLTVDDEPVYNRKDTANENKIGILDLFVKKLEKKYKKDIDMIYAYMNMVANGEHVPGTKYHILERDKNDPYPDFEFKHGKLRVYGVKIDGGKVIFLGGYKTEERKNIQRLRSLKKQFF